MADLPTRVELFDTGAREMIARSEARAPGKRIAPEAIYTEGSDVNVLTAGASAMAEDVLRQAIKADADKYLDSAQGDALDRLVLDRTGRELGRKRAAPAYVHVELTRSSGPLLATTVQAGKRVRTSSGVEFALTSAATFGNGDTGPVRVTTRAVNAGTEGNVAPNTLTELVDSPDQALRVTNAQPAARGADREKDGTYRERARLYFRTVRRGILPAIEFGVRNTPGIAQATVEEQLDEQGDPTGAVLIYIADVNGQANDALVQRVKAQLGDYRGCGIPPRVIGSVPEYIAIEYRVRTLVGYDPESVFDQLRFATVALVNSTPPGMPLEVSLLYSIARRIPGLLVRDDLLESPLGDVYPSATGRTIRTTAALVTPAVSA